MDQAARSCVSVASLRHLVAGAERVTYGFMGWMDGWNDLEEDVV